MRASPLPKAETRALYVTQLGEALWQRELLSWLEEDKRRTLYFIPFSPAEPNRLISPLKEHPRLSIGSVITQFVWEHLCEPWELIGERSATLERAILASEATLALYRDFGALEMTNVVRNMEAVGVLKGEALKGRFAEVPALICGAGPSLNAALPLLKEMGQRALLFGGGSALAPLAKWGIPLHFAAAIDPAPVKRRFMHQSYFETPLLYQNRVASSLLACHHGPKLCMGEGGGFELERWLTEEGGLSPLNGGWTVSTFSTACAALFGCNPIIFVGLDLCVYGERTYAEGVEGVGRSQKNPFTCYDKAGREVTTRLDFLMAKEWLEHFAARAEGVTLINSSFEGLPLKGIPDIPLTLPKQKRDLQGWVTSAVAEAPSLRFSQKARTHFDETLAQTGKAIDDFLSALHNGDATYLQEHALEEQPLFSYHLAPLWEVWKHCLQSRAVVAQMKHPELEKRVQQLLFYKKVVEKLYERRDLPLQ